MTHFFCAWMIPTIVSFFQNWTDSCLQFRSEDSWWFESQPTFAYTGWLFCNLEGTSWIAQLEINADTIWYMFAWMWSQYFNQRWKICDLWMPTIYENWNWNIYHYNSKIFWYVDEFSIISFADTTFANIIKNSTLQEAHMFLCKDKKKFAAIL